ncbi:MAG: tRNA wyosine derivatives biosynthesis protein Taw2 [Euryarchaeota archaeon ADurb.Bin165]|nr:MAG: tRNA wyosine derivatives biosynthesis protein Taw2 [Euryarchaeota archaeon ADurb.Bin165]
MNVREIPRRDMNEVLQDPWVDTGRRPWISGDIAYVPVRDGYPYTMALKERRRKGRGYQKIGSVIAFHGEKPDWDVVSEVIDRHKPEAVIWYRGHRGEMRIPEITVLYGEVSDTMNKESGIIYHLNPAVVMFSQGNREEKRRIAGLVKPGERICDMFAGIGYFTLPMAKAGGHVHAMEINPDAVYFLQKNIQANNLGSRVMVSHGDCRDHITGIYDRIHMGYYDAAKFLATALQHAGPGTMIHVHGIGDNTGEIKEHLDMAGVLAVMNQRIIKKIGPGKVHTVTDLVIK